MKLMKGNAPDGTDGIVFQQYLIDDLNRS